MKSNQIILTTLAIALLNACSIHTTTDLNKIRTEYKSDINQEKIYNINKKRQLEMEFDKATPYAKGIACLSKPYLTNASSSNTNAMATFNKKIQQANDDIDIHKKNIDIIFKTGGIRTQRSSTGIEQIKVEKSIQELALEIEKLGLILTLEKHLKKKLALLEKRDNLTNQFEELKEKLNSEENLLAQAEKQKKDYAEHLNNFDNQQSKADDVFKVAVADIHDKTGKIFPTDSTAISEMVAHALSYNAGIKLVDIPFGNNWNNSRYNPAVNKNLKKIESDDHRLLDIQANPNLLSANMGFAGIVFPSDMYISGALVQYDELPMTRPFGTRISLDIDPLHLSTETRTINIGMVLRAVDSTNALIMDNSNTIEKENGERASVYVQNTYFVKKIGTNVFEINSKRLYGGDVTVEVADPATYLVREMVESGIYKLLKKTIRPSEMSQEDKMVCDQIVDDALNQDYPRKSEQQAHASPKI